jgi:nitrite reductase/ring-hydroxylating ferredoxin subunit/uncharacterized membrane protein
MIKRLVHGAPFKNPLHPALVHFPIGLFTLSVLFDVLFFLQIGNEWLYYAALYTLAGGIFMVVITAIPGLVDWSEIRIDHPGKKTASIHMVLNLSAVVLFAASFLLRLGADVQETIELLPFFISFIALIVLLFSGYMGGKLVYDLGIGVGRYRRPTNLPSSTIKASPDQAEDGYVYVADESDLREGETLRVEINGEVMAIARYQDGIYAFNEFCTHRFGPLSEGPISDGEVECPWHRSCFDIRTGKVVEGPAKIDLKTYEVIIRDGKVAVKTSGEVKNKE